MYLGSDLTLSTAEIEANSQLMALKRAELDQAFIDSTYPPSRHFFQSKADYEKSQVFGFLKEMPKGGALHLHDALLVNVDWLIANMTYEYAFLSHLLSIPIDPLIYP